MFAKYKLPIIAFFLLLVIICGAAIPFVKINYDMTKYLPEDSKTRQALNILEREFERNGYLQLMVDGLPEADIKPFMEKIFIGGIKNIDYSVKDNSVLFKIALEKDDYSRDALSVVTALRKTMDETNIPYYMNGQAYLTYVNNEMMAKQIPVIVLCLVPIILLILFITTSSWLDPLLFAFVVGISVVFNMGTNALLPDVSEMINSIGAVLQFAICMDYSIILLHRFRDCKAESSSPVEAMGKAWRTSIVPIFAASLTTVAGFMAIMFMRYKIGFDTGLILSKGVLLTLLTVIFFMPCLILLLDNLLTKAAHKPLLAVGDNYCRFIYKTRYALPFIAFVLIAAAGYIQTKNKFNYGDNSFNLESGPAAEDNKKIAEKFGLNSQGLLLIPSDITSDEVCKTLAETQINGKSYVTSVVSFYNQMNIDEAMDFLKAHNVARSDMQALFAAINKNNLSKSTISLADIYDYISLLSRFDEPMDQWNMTAFINNFAYAKSDDIASVYKYASQGKMSLFGIISFMQTPFAADKMAEIFKGEIPVETINAAYSTEQKETMSFAAFMEFFYKLLTEKQDAKGMANILGSSASQEEVERLYAMTGESTLSLSDIAYFFDKPLSKNEMKKVFPDVPSIGMNYLYSEIEKETGSSKSTPREFILLIQNKFGSYLNKSQKNMLAGFNEKISVFDDYKQQIGKLKAAAPSFKMLASIDLERIKSYKNIDAGIIKKEFIGADYQRIVFAVDLPEESELSFEYFKLIEKRISGCVDDFYIMAATPGVADVKETSSRDYTTATIVSVILIFLIIAVLFRSVSVPVLLIIVIEGAIFINMAIPAITGRSLFFVGYLIVSCIQLGATIDYGILMSNRYIANRKTSDKRAAMEFAVKEAATSIITSGSILTAAGLSLGLISDVAIISILGRLIGLGGLISSVLVLTVLPQCLFLFDKLIIKKSDAA